MISNSINSGNDHEEFIPPLLNDRLLTELSIRNSLGLETGVSLSLVQKALSIRASMLAKKLAKEESERVAKAKAKAKAEAMVEVDATRDTASSWNNGDENGTSKSTQEQKSIEEEGGTTVINAVEFSAEILNFVEEEDADGGDGSDSDPSGDNLPISTLMKSKALKV